MATFTVTTSADSVDAADGKLSLREALTLANGNPDADTITFASSLEGKTIALSKGQLDIKSDVTITGDPDHDKVGVTIDQRSDELNLDGYGSANVLVIGGAGTAVSLQGMTITGGSAGGPEGTGSAGTGILLQAATLDLASCRVTGNNAWSGGGIAAWGNSTLTIADSDISHNVAFYGGGGLSLAGGTIQLERSTISGNQTYYGGGGIEAWGGALISLLRSAVTENSVGAINSYIDDRGGGIVIADGNIEVVQSTIADNKVKAGNDDAEWPTGAVAFGAGIAAIRTAVLIREHHNGQYRPGTRGACFWHLYLSRQFARTLEQHRHRQCWTI